jgi:hypothetical protein
MPAGGYCCKKTSSSSSSIGSSSSSSVAANACGAKGACANSNPSYSISPSGFLATGCTTCSVLNAGFVLNWSPTAPGTCTGTAAAGCYYISDPFVMPACTVFGVTTYGPYTMRWILSVSKGLSTTSWILSLTGLCDSSGWLTGCYDAVTSSTCSGATLSPCAAGGINFCGGAPATIVVS